MAASGERLVADLAEHYGYYGAADATANGLKNDIRYGCVKTREIEVSVKNREWRSAMFLHQGLPKAVYCGPWARVLLIYQPHAEVFQKIS